MGYTRCLVIVSGLVFQSQLVQAVDLWEKFFSAMLSYMS